jgi:hypothetical protein
VPAKAASTAAAPKLSAPVSKPATQMAAKPADAGDDWETF